jgi:hypothetical protein
MLSCSEIALQQMGNFGRNMHLSKNAKVGSK